MRFKKYLAVLSAALVLCAALPSEAFAAKANIGQFMPPVPAADPKKDAMPVSSPPSNNTSYSSPAPAAHTSVNTGTGIKIGSKSYKTLQDAVNSVKDGQTIHVTKNISLSKLVWCKRPINFSIDFHKKQPTPPIKSCCRV